MTNGYLKLEGFETLKNAIMDNNIQELKSLLAKCYDAKNKNDEGDTLLHVVLDKYKYPIIASFAVVLKRFDTLQMWPKFPGEANGV